MLRLGRHVGHVEGHDRLVHGRQQPGPLGDVDREVADPLQGGVDLDGGDDEAQVAGHRLVERQRLEAVLLDVDLHEVDREVALDGLGGERLVAVLHSGERPPQVVFDQGAQREDALLQVADLALQLCRHGRPSLSRTGR